MSERVQEPGDAEGMDRRGRLPTHGAWLVVLTLVAAACAAGTTPDGPDGTPAPVTSLRPELSDPLTTLAAGRERWLANGPETYTMTVRYSRVGSEEDAVGGCGGSGPLLVLVENKQPMRVIDQGRTCEVDPAALGDAPITVGRIFDLIEANLDAERLDVTYDQTLGYPELVNASYPTHAVSASVQGFTSGRGTFGATAVLLDELDRGAATWAAAELDDYTMTIEVRCMCEPNAKGPFDVTVADRGVIDVQADGTPATPHPWVPLTVEELFDFAADYAYSASIIVDFAPEGYPTLITVNPVTETVDDEFSVRVTNFEPDPGGSS